MGNAHQEGLKLLRGDVEWETKAWGSEYQRWFDEDGQQVEYRDWTDGTTRVVSGPYGPASKSNFPGRRFRDRRSARLYWSLRAGVVEEYMVPGRWILRVRRVA